MIGTAHVHAADSLHAEVKVLREINEMFWEVEIISGVGGWDKPGKVIVARKSITSEITPADAEAPGPVEIDEPRPLSAPVTVDEYMKILVRRQEAWLAAHPRASRTFPPLCEWFIRSEDERWIILPKSEPAPKKERKPRVYRSAESLREERDKVQAKRDAIADAGPYDPAFVNLSPYARDKAAARAGRRRFEKMDRDLQRYAELSNRLDALNFRIRTAEARERKTA